MYFIISRKKPLFISYSIYIYSIYLVKKNPPPKKPAISLAYARYLFFSGLTAWGAAGRGGDAGSLGYYSF